LEQRVKARLDKVKSYLEFVEPGGRVVDVRSYDQYCGLARALDVVGDRWTLLIVRELLIAGACRYTDLQYGLPGIATNLLADRLRQLEDHGIITPEAAPPPIATTLYRLTPRGEELSAVLKALGRWGAPLVEETPEGAVFRSHWLALPLRFHLADQVVDGPPVTIEIRTGDQPIMIETIDGHVRVRPGRAPDPDATITATPALVLGLLSGELALEDAVANGLEFQGDADALRRVQPKAVSAR
jgi:DNA-binding HxlR family transcriptional regulator